MLNFKEHLQNWLHWAGFGLDPFAAAVRKARLALNRISGRGTIVPDDISNPILGAEDAIRKAEVIPQIEQEFYGAYSKLARLVSLRGLGAEGDSADTFQDALDDSELLLKHASESGVEIDKAIVEPILAAQTAFKTSALTDPIRGAFYEAYAKLAKLFGDVTADTIRNCSSPETRRTLARDRNIAVSLTVIIAIVSVFMFVTDAMSTKIVADMNSANASAASLRAGLTPAGANQSIDEKYATDPCKYIKAQPVGQNIRSVANVSDVQQLQQFAATIRDLNGRAVKLNVMLLWQECGDFSTCWDRKHNESLGQDSNSRLQLNPAILDYTAEVLCKIQTYQVIRAFAGNVREDYVAAIGAFASYALPIVYALLGAYAYRLRLFAETIRRRTYHRSFSDSARMITAVIAGAMSGLINPAKGMALSPLATAFLVGYGVELFFRFLDTLISAFGSSTASGQPPTK